MHRILGTVRPTGNALGPPGGPPTMVLLGKGGSGALWGWSDRTRRQAISSAGSRGSAVGGGSVGW
jgi:hypothetical protein